jgi:hypothetical protein
MNPVKQQLRTESKHDINVTKKACNVREAVRWRQMSEHEKLQTEEKNVTCSANQTRLHSHLVQLLVKRTAKPLVAAATAGVMPSSNNIGDRIIPAAMPRAPAAMPQTKQIAGYKVVHLLSQMMSPLSDL